MKILSCGRDILYDRAYAETCTRPRAPEGTKKQAAPRIYADQYEGYKRE